MSDSSLEKLRDVDHQLHDEIIRAKNLGEDAYREKLREVMERLEERSDWVGREGDQAANALGILNDIDES